MTSWRSLPRRGQRLQLHVIPPNFGHFPGCLVFVLLGHPLWWKNLLVAGTWCRGEGSRFGGFGGIPEVQKRWPQTFCQDPVLIQINGSKIIIGKHIIYIYTVYIYIYDWGKSTVRAFCCLKSPADFSCGIFVGRLTEQFAPLMFNNGLLAAPAARCS